MPVEFHREPSVMVLPNQFAISAPVESRCLVKLYNAAELSANGVSELEATRSA